jgi:lysophospholipase L1-like esterase
MELGLGLVAVDQLDEHEFDPFNEFFLSPQIYGTFEKTGHGTFYQTIDKDYRYVEFSRQKSENTFRIFCVGASTVQGFGIYPQYFPERLHFYHDAFCHLLAGMLMARYPDISFEVINAGRDATESLRLRRFLTNEIVKLEPDLILLYTGENEFSTDYVKDINALALTHPTLFALQKYLRLSHIYQTLLKYLPRSQFRATETISGQTTYRQYKEALLAACVRFFRENLLAMIEATRQHGIPLLLSNPVCHLKRPPVESTHADSLSIKDHQRFAVNYRWAWSGQLVRDQEMIRIMFQDLSELDPEYAEAHYILAQTLEEFRDYPQALYRYKMARDNDTSPLRPTTAIYRVFDEVKAQARPPIMVDLAEEFEQQVYPAIPGDNLFNDYVHPNATGHHIMAETYFQKIVDEKIIEKSTRIPQRLKTPAPDRLFSVSERLLRGEAYAERGNLTAAIWEYRLGLKSTADPTLQAKLDEVLKLDKKLNSKIP